jgi:site-specific DNA recombinase
VFAVPTRCVGRSCASARTIGRPLGYAYYCYCPVVRAAIYVRQSKDRGQTGLAIERQRADCERMCRERGWQIMRVITDNDVSATYGPRPGYSQLLSLAEQGAVDVLVCWHVDRLTRRLTELEHVIELCERTGVRVATASGDLDLSTDAGRLVGRILASVAKGEVERKSARQSRAGRQAAESGAPPKRRAFGYRDGGMEVDPVEGLAVREAFVRLLAGGSLSGITKSLNAAGLRTVGGKPWTIPAVRVMLRNGRYAAIRFYRRTEEIGRGYWPAIVSEETWRAAVALLDDPTRRTTIKGTARRWLGAAFYRCGRCGSDMCSGYRQYGDYRRRVYRCRAHLGHLSRVADPVDEYVSAVIVARLRRPDLADLLAEPTPDVAPLREEAAALRLRIEQLADDIGLDETTLARRVRALQGRLYKVRDQLAEAGRSGALAGVLAAPDPGSAWLGLDVVGKQAVARELCTVTLLPAPAGRKPFDIASVRITPRTL